MKRRRTMKRAEQHQHHTKNICNIQTKKKTTQLIQLVANLFEEHSCYFHVSACGNMILCMCTKVHVHIFGGTRLSCSAGSGSCDARRARAESAEDERLKSSILVVWHGDGWSHLVGACDPPVFPGPRRLVRRRWVRSVPNQSNQQRPGRVIRDGRSRKLCLRL